VPVPRTTVVVQLFSRARPCDFAEFVFRTPVRPLDPTAKGAGDGRERRENALAGGTGRTLTPGFSKNVDDL